MHNVYYLLHFAKLLLYNSFIRKFNQIRSDTMGKLLNSKFETYLMDQEFDFYEEEEKNEEQMEKVHYEEYPEGFFTSL